MSKKIFLTLISFLIYLISFYVLVRFDGEKATVLSLIPIITLSLFYGFKPGISAALLMALINTLFLDISGLPGTRIMIENIPGILGSFFIAAAAGYMGALNRNSKRQLIQIENEKAERRKAEEKLFKIQSKFNFDIRSENKTFRELNHYLIEEHINIPQKVYREIAENATDIIYLTNTEGYFIYANKMALKNCGYSEQELFNIKYTELIVPEFRDRVKLQYFRQYIKKQPGSYLEFPFIMKDNSLKWYGQNATLIFEDGEVAGFSFIARDITDRKKMELDLKENEERLRLITQTATDAIITTDNNYIIVQWNKAAVKMYGYAEDEILGKPVLILMKEEDRQFFEKNVIPSDDPINKFDLGKPFEKIAITKDGSDLPVEITIASWKSKDVTYYTHIIRNIKDRKEAEHKIRLLASSIESTSEIISLTDLNNRFLFVNKAFLDTYGFTEQEVLGKTPEIVASDKNPTKIIPEIHNTTINGNWSGRLYNKKKSGEEFLISLNTTCINDQNGNPIALVGIARDITQEILANEKLRESEERFRVLNSKLEKLVLERTERLKEVNRMLFAEIKKLTEADERIQNQIEFFKTLINTIPLPVFIRDKNVIYVDCNKSFENFFGLERSEIVGKSVFDLYSNEIAVNYREMDEKILTSPGEQYYESHEIDKNGNVHEVIIYQAAFCKNDGSAEGIVGVILDITPQKNLQREIRKSLEKEKELSELKSRFISVASHEFRTPLTTILASADLIEILGPNQNEVKFKNHVAKIQNAVGYMTELIDDVLLVNKAETGRIAFNPLPLNLSELAKEVLDNARSIANSSHTFSIIYEAVNEIYQLDRKLLTQILSNLLSNAVKYSPDGGNISLKISEAELKIYLNISDNGLGISEDDQKLLFQPFYRGKNTGNISGTGLGLSIVKKAVELHKGELFVQSSLKKGTTFTVVLPVISNV